MERGGSPGELLIGFLTAVEHAQLGTIGGYLILNATGRPLEFHCTAPVKPSRPQEILYGPSLQPYLYGEVIGQTLLEKSGRRVSAVVTDLPTMMAVREHVSKPVLLVHPAEDETLRVDGPQASQPSVPFSWGRNRVCAVRAIDQSTVAERLGGLPEAFDLGEPFERIREAIREAQGTSTET